MKWRREEWRTLSREFTERHELPYGSKVILLHTDSGRQARSDRVFNYRRFKKRAPGDCTITQLFNEYLRPKFSVSLYDHNLEPKLIGPTGQIPSGQTKLKTVRHWSPLKKELRMEATDEYEAMIEEVVSEANCNLRFAEEDREPEVVGLGYLRALDERFGKTLVEQWRAKLS